MALRIFHTADWHLGQTFFGYDREHEHKAFLDWLADTLTQESADVLLIAGDVFDVSNPSAASQRLFFRFLREVNRRNPQLQIIIIAGNHDSAARLEAPLPLLEELNTHIVGTVKRNGYSRIDFDSLLIPLYNKEKKKEAVCLAVPYLRQGDYPASDNADEKEGYASGIGRMYRDLTAYADQQRDSGVALIAMGHLHVSGAEISENDRSERVIMGGLESVAAHIFNEKIAYTALGHIHKAQKVGGREEIRYAGSPLPMSFSEQHYLHQLVAITIADEKMTEIRKIPIPVTCELQKVPAHPDIPEKVMEALNALPDSREEEDRNLYPYIEVQVLLTEPDPGLRHRIEEAITTKAVRLTSIVPYYPNRKEEGEVCPMSYADLQKLDPLDMLRHAFAARYGGELPDELARMFQETMQDVSS